MLREVITLPLRMAAFATRAGVEVAMVTLGAGVAVGERLMDRTAPELVTPSESWTIDLVTVPAAPESTDVADAEPAEPWAGYAHMNAHDVIHRLATATTDEAAAVERYERDHAGRKTVLTAVERQLRRRGRGIGGTQRRASGSATPVRDQVRLMDRVRAEVAAGPGANPTADRQDDPIAASRRT